MSQVMFTNPKTAETYSWPVNPPFDGPQPINKTRQIQRTSNTGNVGATKQQGDDGPVILNWNVKVFHAAQETAIWRWYALSELQTIYLTDWLGQESEGQIIAVGDQFAGAITGPGDTRSRQGYNLMSMQFEVYRFISGVMATAGVTP